MKSFFLKHNTGVKNLFFSYLLSFSLLFLTQLIFAAVYGFGSNLLQGSVLLGIIYFSASINALAHLFVAPLFLWLFPILKNKNYIFSAALAFLLQLAFLAAQSVDLIYFKFTQKRSTWDLFALMGAEDLDALLWSFIKDYWWMFLAVLLFSLLLLVVNKKMFSNLHHNSAWGLGLFLNSFSKGVLCIGLLLVVGRGGLQVRPISMLDANKFGAASESVVILNTPFTLITTAGVKGLNPIPWIDEKGLVPFQTPQSVEAPFNLKEPNVVLIILESFSAEALQHFNPNSASYAPFLDSLAQHSMTFQQCYANGRRSVDALPAMISGLPNLMNEAYLFSSYTATPIKGLPDLLGPDYQTAFFHGAKNGSMNFESYCYQAGFDKYYGSNEYPNAKADHDGTWGIFDEPFLQFYAEQMKAMKTPFFTSVFTLSSHPPYALPKHHQNLKKENDLPIHTGIRYTDLALRRFFENIKDWEAYSNTIFIITADHVAPELPKTAPNYIKNYWVPLLIFQPQHSQGHVYQHPVQHADILNSVLSLCNQPLSDWPFSQILWNEKQHHPIFHYINQQYEWTSGTKRYFYKREHEWFEQDYLKEPLKKTWTSEPRVKDSMKSYLQHYQQLFLGKK